MSLSTRLEAPPLHRPARSEPLDVAVVGAGLSGLVCARTLAEHGDRVQVIDKSRGVGGRMSTRRAGAWRFDHGAQYFTVRDPRFARWVEAWRGAGLVATWAGAIARLDRGQIQLLPATPERLVGVPGMSAACRHLAAELRPTLQTRVVAIEPAGDRWRLTAQDGSDLGSFDAVVVSAPAPQTAELLAVPAPELAARAAGAEMAPCWAVMVAFDAPLELGFDGAFVDRSPLSWIARNASKPGRPDGETWVLHATPEWSLSHLELAREAVGERLVDAFHQATGRPQPAPVHLAAHRWRFALPASPLPEPCLFDPARRIAACGDWCGGPRVEGAFLSGRAAADRILALPSGPEPRESTP